MSQSIIKYTPKATGSVQVSIVRHLSIPNGGHSASVAPLEASALHPQVLARRCSSLVRFFLCVIQFHGNSFKACLCFLLKIGSQGCCGVQDSKTTMISGITAIGDSSGHLEGRDKILTQSAKAQLGSLEKGAG